MEIAAAVVGIGLAIALAISASGKLTRMDPVVETLTKVNVPTSMFPALAALEIAGAIGLVVGIWVAWIGIAAAVGVVLYFVGAVVFHLRAGDTAGAGPALFLGLMAVVAGLLRSLA